MNWTPELIISLITAATGLVGALAGVAAIWFSHGERLSAYRQALYQKQFEAYTAVLDYLNVLYVSCASFILEKPSHYPLDSEMRQQLAQATADKGMEFANEYHKRLLFIPRTIQEKVTKFVNVLDTITASDEEADQNPNDLVYSDDPLSELLDAYLDVIEAARLSLGIEPLSKDIMSLVGTRETSGIMRFVNASKAKNKDKLQQSSD